jgi:hypothetical protein
MKKFLLIASFIFILYGAAFSVFAQDEAISHRYFHGVVKDDGNKPAAGKTVCGLPSDNRPLSNRIPCATTQKDGSFSIAIRQWEGESYHIFVQETESGMWIPDWGNSPFIVVTALDETKSLEIKLHPEAGRAILKIVDETGKAVESGRWKMCLTDQPAICQSMSRAFPKGIVEVIMPASAVTLEIETSNGGNWEKRFVFDENGQLIETIQVEPGQKKVINIRLKR